MSSVQLRNTTLWYHYQWPAKEWLESKSVEELTDLRIKKVEWATAICRVKLD